MGSCKKKNYTHVYAHFKKTPISFICELYIFIHTFSHHSAFKVEGKYNTHLKGFFFLKHKINIVVICITQYQLSPLLNHKVAWTRRLQHLEVIRCISAYICLIKYIHVPKFEIKSQISFTEME